MSFGARNDWVEVAAQFGGEGCEEVTWSESTLGKTDVGKI